MSVEKWWNEIFGRENGRNPEKNLPRLRFIHRKTDMEWSRRELGIPAMGGERLTASRDLRPHIETYYITVASSSECSAQRQVFTGNSGTKAAVLPKGRSSTANSGTKFTVLLGMNRCGNFLLH